MKPTRTDSQRSLFSFPLEKILDPDHPLVMLVARIDWSQFDDLVDERYSEEGQPGCTTRLMIGIPRKAKRALQRLLRRRIQLPQATEHRESHKEHEATNVWNDLPADPHLGDF